LATAERSDSGARYKALYLNLVYRKRLAYDIGWARLDAFCLVPLSLRSVRRRRVAPNLNQEVENATLKNYSAGAFGGLKAEKSLSKQREKAYRNGPDKSFRISENIPKSSLVCDHLGAESVVHFLG